MDRLHAKLPEDRDQSAEDVSSLLGECLNHVQTPHHPLPKSLPITPGRKRTGRWQIGIIVCAGFLLIAGGLVAKFQAATSESTNSGESQPAAADENSIVVDQAEADPETNWDDGIDRMLLESMSEADRLERSTEGLENVEESVRDE